MTVKLICENILDDDDFLSATEQEGIRIGQPVPDGALSGEIRLVSRGRSFGDESKTATTTGDGAGGGTTVVCTDFLSECDDFYIGATITINDGACSGESKTVTDFAQATGTFTTGAFSAQIVSGVSFTVSFDADTRSFDVEIVDSGDVGDGTFKWSHDGGTTYFGARDPKTTAHFTDNIYDSGHYPDEGRGAVCCQTTDGDVFAFLLDASDGNDLVCYKATIPINATGDWSKVGKVYDDEPNGLMGALALKSGRILVYYEDSSNDNKVGYSDDDGVTWTEVDINMPVERAIELTDGTVLGIYGGSSYVRLVVSMDGGLTFSTSYVNHTIDAGDAEGQCDIVEAANGDIVIAWREGASNFYIEAATSESRGGAFENTGKAVMNYNNPGAGDKWQFPCLVRGPDGTLYCYGEYQNGDDIYVVTSTDNGLTWSNPNAPTAVYTGTHMPGQVLLLPNMKHFILSYDTTNNDIDYHYTGGWNVFSANGATMAVGTLPQELVCGAQLVWHGRNAIDGDDWTMEAEYDYGMENIIADSPLDCFRSTQDNIACNIVIDMGAAANHYVTGVAFFGCNVRTLSLQMNDTDAWGAPSVDESISFDLTSSGEIDAVNDNYIQDTALLASYKDHELKGCYLRLTAGAASGTTYEILDNVGNYIVVDGDAEADGAAADDTFAIFQSSVSDTFTGGVYRYMRVAISAQHTADDYYQIGTMVAGYAVSLSRDFARGFGKSHIYEIEQMRTVGGGLLPVKRAERRRRFELTWPHDDDSVEEVLALLDYIQERNIALIPSTATECYLVKLSGNADLRHRKGDEYDLTVAFEEVL